MSGTCRDSRLAKAKPAFHGDMSAYINRNEELRILGFSNYGEYLKSDLWDRIRKRVFERDSGWCYGCGCKANQVHHRDYSRSTLKGCIDSLVSLCPKCHKKIELIDGRKCSLEAANKKLDELRRQRFAPATKKHHKPPAKAHKARVAEPKRVEVSLPVKPPTPPTEPPKPKKKKRQPRPLQPVHLASPCGNCKAPVSLGDWMAANRVKPSLERFRAGWIVEKVPEKVIDPEKERIKEAARAVFRSEIELAMKMPFKKRTRAKKKAADKLAAIIRENS